MFLALYPTLRRAIASALSAGVLLTIAVSALGAAIVPLARNYGTAWMRDAVDVKYQSLGLVRVTHGDSTWEIQRRTWLLRTDISALRMQISGRAMMIPQADFEARQFDLSTLPAPQQPGPINDEGMWNSTIACGFPFRAFVCRVNWVTQNNSIVTWGATGGILIAENPNHIPHAIPYTPLWFGLTLDVLIWSCAWVLLTRGLTYARIWHRHRHARCLKCGYPRTPGSVCPECGSPTKKKGPAFAGPM